MPTISADTTRRAVAWVTKAILVLAVVHSLALQGNAVQAANLNPACAVQEFYE